MRIGIVSDTHSRHETVAKAQELLRAEAVELILHCGDIEDADTVRQFADTPTHFVFGNCDYDRDALGRAVREIGATLHDPFGELELAGRKIAFVHSDDKRLFRQLEAQGGYDFLFYGHTHHAEEHRTGSTRVVNPGALHRANPKTFVVLDLKSGEMKTLVAE